MDNVVGTERGIEEDDDLREGDDFSGDDSAHSSDLRQFLKICVCVRFCLQEHLTKEKRPIEKENLQEHSRDELRI